MAKVVVKPNQDLREIARRAGGNPRLIIFDPPTNELEVPDVAQAALDAAFLDYDTNQAAIDAATAATRKTERKDASKAEFDVNRELNAIVEVIRDELNALRRQHALADKTFAELRAAILNEIDAGP